MSPSRHSRRHSLPHIPTFNLGEDIDLAIGLTASLLAGNEFLESSLSHDGGSQASHLLKAGLSAVVAAGAFKIFGREHRENASDERDHHRGGHTHTSHRHRLHHGGNRPRIEDGDEHRHEHHHGHRHRRHHRHRGYFDDHDVDDDDQDQDQDLDFRTLRGHRNHLREADEDRLYRRHSFESGGSRRSGRAHNYRHDDGDFGLARLNLRDLSPLHSEFSSRRQSDRSEAAAAAGQVHGRPPPGHHVHFTPNDEDY